MFQVPAAGALGQQLPQQLRQQRGYVSDVCLACTVNCAWQELTVLWFSPALVSSHTLAHQHLLKYALSNTQQAETMPVIVSSSPSDCYTWYGHQPAVCAACAVAVIAVALVQLQWALLCSSVVCPVCPALLFKSILREAKLLCPTYGGQRNAL